MGATPPSEVIQSNPRRLRAIAAVAVLIVLFATLSYTAALSKCATCDETLHLVGGMVQRQQHDYRIDPEDPALLGWWATLPISAARVPLDVSSPAYKKTVDDVEQEWHFSVETLYGGKCDAAGVLNASRVMFLLLGIALAALIALWAYELAGPWAAIAATALFCFDPNFLGHSALVKNDVPASLVFCATAYSLWRFGRSQHRWGWVWMLATAVLCGIAINLKFSGILLVILVPLLLLTRAVLSPAWRLARWELDAIASRLMLAVVGIALVAVTVFVITWASYGFWYRGTSDGSRLPTARSVANVCASVEIRVKIFQEVINDLPSEEIWKQAQRNVQEGELPLSVNVAMFASEHHLLPEAWAYGFLYTYATSRIRDSFLLGRHSPIGWWYYFPLTILFKSTTATLLAMFAIPIACSFERTRVKIAQSDGYWVWSWLTLATLPAIYFITALTTNLNLGIRHILPIFPFLYIGLGIGFAVLARRWKRTTLVCGVLLFIGLAIESLAAYPNYISFFNAPGGGARNGVNLLGDSNLDWGQDLPALARWQKLHPDTRLYLSYFGTANPAYYGIRYTNILGGWEYAPTTGLTAEPGVIAISATRLQGLRWDVQQLAYYVSKLDPVSARRIAENTQRDQDPTDELDDALRRVKPREVLNGTIYMYDWPRP